MMSAPTSTKKEYTAKEIEELLKCFDELFNHALIAARGCIHLGVGDAVDRAVEWADRNEHPLPPDPDE